LDETLGLQSVTSDGRTFPCTHIIWFKIIGDNRLMTKTSYPGEPVLTRTHYLQNIPENYFNGKLERIMLLAVEEKIELKSRRYFYYKEENTAYYKVTDKTAFEDFKNIVQAYSEHTIVWTNAYTLVVFGREASFSKSDIE
jgi:hypothetical protein